MYKTIIIDDEPLARNVIKDYLRNHPSIELVAECNDGFEGVKAIQQYKPDIIFLDIQMPKINGFEMLELIENPPPVIFTTAFETHAIKAFEAHAIDYLLKPFGKDRFDKALQKWQQSTPAQTQAVTQNLLEDVNNISVAQTHRIVVKDGEKIKIIPVGQIIFLEAADDYVKIHTADGAFLKKKTMQYFEQALPPQQFVRTHRSYIVNVQLITKIYPYEKDSHLVLLTTGAKLPVSKTGYARLKEILGI
jgi:two-component system LytT family response regulator